MYREAFLLEKAPPLGELAAKQTERARPLPGQHGPGLALRKMGSGQALWWEAAPFVYDCVR